MPGLSFLAPWFLAALAAVGVPIFLHLRHRETAREVPFSATRFVPVAPVQQARRKLPTDWLLLALRCLAIALLAFAFARPYVGQSASASAPATVVALDVSYSMGGPGTWAAAQAAALKAIDEAAVGTDVAVLAFDESARTMSPLSADRAAARRAVSDLRPGIGATSYAAPLAAATDLLGGRPGRAVIVTDTQRVGLRGAVEVPASLSVSLAPVPAAKTNLAVVSASRDDAAVVATIANSGLEARTSEVVLEADGRVVGRQPVSVDGGSARLVRFDGMARDRGLALVRVTDTGGVPADDQRTLLFDPAPGLRVWLIAADGPDGPGGFYLERALTTAGRSPASVRRLTVPVDRLPDVVAVDDRPDVVALLATRGLARDARAQLASLVRDGTGLLVAVGPDVDAGALADLLPSSPLRVEQADAAPVPAALTPMEARHPVFAVYADRASAFARVRFDRLVRATVAPGDRVLATFDNGLVAVLERVAGNGRVLLLASDVDGRWNQWPVSPTFLPFAREAVRHLSRRVPEPREFVAGHAPAGIDGTPGVHVLAGGRRVVVNVDPDESSLDLLEAQEFTAALAQRAAIAATVARGPVEVESTQSIWRYVMAFALGVLLLEALVGARRAATISQG